MSDDDEGAFSVGLSAGPFLFLALDLEGVEMSQKIERPDQGEAVADAERAASREEAMAGLGQGRWGVRLGSVLWLHKAGDLEALSAVVPLTRDPKRKVRQLATFVVGTRREAAELEEAVPLLMERILQDTSIKVRRLATQVLAYERAHPDLSEFLQELLDTETDEKLHRAAGIGFWLSRNDPAPRSGETNR